MISKQQMLIKSYLQTVQMFISKSINVHDQSTLELYLSTNKSSNKSFNI